MSHSPESTLLHKYASSPFKEICRGNEIGGLSFNHVDACSWDLNRPPSTLPNTGVTYGDSVLDESPFSPKFFEPCLSRAPTDALSIPSASRLPTVPFFEGPSLDLPDESQSPSVYTPWLDEGSSFNSSFLDNSYWSDTTTSSADTTFDTASWPCTPSVSKFDFSTHLNSRTSSQSRGLGLGIIGLSKTDGLGQFDECEGPALRSPDDSCSGATFPDPIYLEEMAALRCSSNPSSHEWDIRPFFYEHDDIEYHAGPDSHSSLIEESIYGRALTSIPECDSWFEAEEASCLSASAESSPFVCESTSTVPKRRSSLPGLGNTFERSTASSFPRTLSLPKGISRLVSTHRCWN